ELLAEPLVPGGQERLPGHGFFVHTAVEFFEVAEEAVDPHVCEDAPDSPRPLGEAAEVRNGRLGAPGCVPSATESQEGGQNMAPVLHGPEQQVLVLEVLALPRPGHLRVEPNPEGAACEVPTQADVVSRG